MALQATSLPSGVRAHYPYLHTTTTTRAVGTLSCLLLRGIVAINPRDLLIWPRCRTAMRRVHAETTADPLGRWLAAKLPAPYGDKPDTTMLAQPPHGVAAKQTR